MPSRREFFRVPLIGTALASGPFQPRAVAGTGKSVVIPTHEFAGDIDERLDFPAGWDVHVMQMAGHDAPAIGARQLAAAMSRPVGTRPLRELAAGKTKVVITFDDLTRTTPTYTIAPWVVGELRAAGVPEENILFLGSFGTHRLMTFLEIQKKLGQEIATRYAWTNHNVFDCLKEIGRTSFGNRVLLNQTFLAADLKICLSGIKVHQDAGYGGGAKAVLPGVAGLPTVEYNHTAILGHTPTTGPVRVFKNEMRLDMIEAARMARVDFTVQLLYNQKLRPIRVFSGDIVEAHHAACRVAAKTYCTPTFPDADIVVTNGYPQNAQAYHSQRWIGYSVREGGTGVLIIQHPLTLDPVHYLNNRLAGRGGATYWDLRDRRLGARLPRHSHLIVYSQYASRMLEDWYPRGTEFCGQWAGVIQALERRHKGDVRVAVYPYGGMQHQEIELDG